VITDETPLTVEYLIRKTKERISSGYFFGGFFFRLLGDPELGSKDIELDDRVG
jgi:hypothetical protein